MRILVLIFSQKTDVVKRSAELKTKNYNLKNIEFIEAAVTFKPPYRNKREY
jgi:hypothetical protein